MFCIVLLFLLALTSNNIDAIPIKENVLDTEMATSIRNPVPVLVTEPIASTACPSSDANSYAIPAVLYKAMFVAAEGWDHNTFSAHPVGQFVDINGDSLNDFVYAWETILATTTYSYKCVYLNTGKGWQLA